MVPQKSLAALLLVACVLLVHAEVEMLDPVHDDQVISLLVERKGDSKKAVFTQDTKGRLPPGTTELRHMDGVENAKCRFTCWEDKICSGYKWTSSTNTCVLLAAPSHLDSPAANSAWHRAAAKIMGVSFVPDPTEAAMAEMAANVAARNKEDERRGQLGIDGNMKEEIEKVKQRKQAKIKAAKNAHEMKQATIEAKYAEAQIRQFVADHRGRFDARVNRLVNYEAKEKAKQFMRTKEAMKLQEEENFEKFDQKFMDVTNQMKDSVKGHITRKETRLFMQNLEKHMLTKMTAFKEEMLEREAAGLKSETEKKQDKAADEKEAKDGTAEKKSDNDN